jgi:hypothetical protein
MLAASVAGVLVVAGVATGRTQGEKRRQMGPDVCRDVAPIVYAKCVTCHRLVRPPFSLISYDDVKKWQDHR